MPGGPPKHRPLRSRKVQAEPSLLPSVCARPDVRPELQVNDAVQTGIHHDNSLFEPKP